MAAGFESLLGSLFESDAAGAPVELPVDVLSLVAVAVPAPVEAPVSVAADAEVVVDPVDAPVSVAVVVVVVVPDPVEEPADAVVDPVGPASIAACGLPSKA